MSSKMTSSARSVHAREKERRRSSWNLLKAKSIKLQREGGKTARQQHKSLRRISTRVTSLKIATPKEGDASIYIIGESPLVKGRPASASRARAQLSDIANAKEKRGSLYSRRAPPRNPAGTTPRGSPFKSRSINVDVKLCNKDERSRGEGGGGAYFNSKKYCRGNASSASNASASFANIGRSKDRFYYNYERQSDLESSSSSESEELITSGDDDDDDEVQSPRRLKFLPGFEKILLSDSYSPLPFPARFASAALTPPVRFTGEKRRPDGGCCCPVARSPVATTPTKKGIDFPPRPPPCSSRRRSNNNQR
eukprot:jgi/Bigna1/80161/fgenesh1_pg.68_\